MKSFVIFPTICIFILSFAVLRINKETSIVRNFIFSFLVAGILGGLLLVFSTEVFMLLYLGNFVFVLVLIPFLTFLVDDFLPQVAGRKLWIRLFGIGLLATITTLALFAATFFYALSNNPMDP
jgi:hypothetical protein